MRGDHFAPSPQAFELTPMQQWPARTNAHCRPTLPAPLHHAPLRRFSATVAGGEGEDAAARTTTVVWAVARGVRACGAVGRRQQRHEHQRDLFLVRDGRPGGPSQGRKWERLEWRGGWCFVPAAAMSTTLPRLPACLPARLARGFLQACVLVHVTRWIVIPGSIDIPKANRAPPFLFFYNASP